MTTETSDAINDLGAAADAAKAGIRTYDTSTGATEGADKIQERWREAERDYGSGLDVKEAAQRIKQKAAEAPTGPTAEHLAEADAEQHRRVAERMGATGGVDLNKITLTKPDEPLTARNA